MRMLMQYSMHACSERRGESLVYVYSRAADSLTGKRGGIAPMVGNET
jgi:hypothetical protein